MVPSGSDVAAHRAWIRAARLQSDDAERAARDAQAAAASSLTRLFEAEHFPGYLLQHEIHRGAQGVVYHAVQRSTGRPVAIKVMREGPFAGPTDRARFEREVRVLAQLRHPDIVAIHDSGQAAGHFFLVMDYIAGRPIDVHAAARRDVRATLRLFARICAAVNAAHLHGVLHRDLKPGNILIDADGTPHILDFGLAKFADEAPAESSSAGLTLTGQFVGSLPWCSPEQAAGAALDIRTDVYSLGVLLYHMLTGRFPYPVGGSVDAVLSAVRSQPPTRPRALRRELDDEVETILLKCLQKEPARRYQSAGELARDIAHYLAGEPIAAKRDSAAYVLRKTLQRHRAVTAVAAAFALLITTGFVATFTLWQQARRDRDRAAREAGRAEQALQREAEQRRLADDRREQVQQVADFQARMLSDIDPAAMGREIQTQLRRQVEAGLRARWLEGADGRMRRMTDDELAEALARFERAVAPGDATDLAREVMSEYVLARAADALETQFADQPLIRAQLHQALGNTYQSLGLYNAGEPHLRSALELRRCELGEEHPDVALSLNELAVLLSAKGDKPAAEIVYREALALRRRLFGDKHLDVALSLNNLGVLLKDMGRYVEAEPLFREALSLRRELLGAEHPHVAITLNNLGTLLRSKGDYGEAEFLLREALELRRRVLGDEHLDTATSLNDLAWLLSDVGQFAAAEILQREALALRRKLLGNDHPVVATSLNNLAMSLQNLGNYSAAEPLHREALALRVRLLGNEHPDVAISANNLAMLLQAKGEYDEAETLLRQALRTWRSRFGDEHPHVATCINNLAMLLRARGDYDAAEPLYREALALFKKLLGDQHRLVATTLFNLGVLHKDKRDYVAAESLISEALALHRKQVGDEHPDVALCQFGLAEVRRASGDLAAAETLYSEALALRRKLLGDKHPHVAAILRSMGSLRYEQGDLAAAEPLLREALAIYQAKLPPGHADTATTSDFLGRTLIKLSRFAEAEALLLESYRLAESRGTSRQRAVAGRLIELYEAWDQAEPGANKLEQAQHWRTALHDLK